MMLKRFDIWIADMNPSFGSESGKIRPVLIVQTDVLNQLNYPSTIICPISSQQQGLSRIRIPVDPSNENGLQKSSSIIIDQITAIDVAHLKSRAGTLEQKYRDQVIFSLVQILNLENNY